MNSVGFLLWAIFIEVALPSGVIYMYYNSPQSVLFHIIGILVTIKVVKRFFTGHMFGILYILALAYAAYSVTPWYRGVYLCAACFCYGLFLEALYNLHKANSMPKDL